MSTLDQVEAKLNIRWGENQIEPTTERIVALLDLLGNPQDAYPCIHIAGTNGKTSTSRMIDALAQQFSLRTGRFTSPHLHSVTERICIDGIPLEEQRFVELYEEIEPFVDIIDKQFAPIRLSKFEILTALAFMAFAETPVDIGIIEVGMGGRWDSTNVIAAKIDVITPIDTDHQEYLGNTIGQIAAEKAGIIKPLPQQLLLEDPVVITAKQSPEALEKIIAQVERTGAIIARFGHEFTVLSHAVAVGGQVITLQGLGGVYEDIFLPLHGSYQADNAAVALAAVEAFLGAGKDRKLDSDSINAGFELARSPGRLERIAAYPTVLVDAAHNPHSAAALAKALHEDFHFEYLVGVVAVLEGKDSRGILEAFESVMSEIIVTSNESFRALPAPELYEIAVSVFGLQRVHMSDSLVKGIGNAVDMVTTKFPAAGGGVIITGSVVTAAAARETMNVEFS